MYTRELEYVIFLAERSIEDARNSAYIQECLVLSEGVDVVNKINTIHEAVIDKVKLTWKKIKEWLKNVWAKFIEKFNKLAMNDANYLKEYKDIIFNRKPIDATYTMYDYPTAIYRCTQVKVPKLNYAQMKDSLDPQDLSVFVKKYLPEMAKDYDGKQNIEDFIKIYFKGGSEDTQEINVSKLKFADMYDFCVNYSKIIKTVENDKKAIDESFAEAEKTINSIPSKEAPTPDANNNQQQSGTTESVIDRFFADSNKSVYSRVYNTYINEDGDGNRVVNNSDNKSTSSGNTSISAASNISSQTDNDKNDNRSADQRANDTKAAVGEDEQQKAIEQIGVYNKICPAIMSAKLSAVENARTTYMKILRAHIKDHVGNKDSQKGSNTARTDYRSPYERSSAEKQQQADTWAKNNINTSFKDLLGTIKEGKPIVKAVLDKINANSKDVINWIGQENFDTISSATVQ